MSQISGFGSIDAAARSTPNKFSEMSSEEFIKIIFTELSNQDPLQPNDSAALLQQLSSIRTIETDMKLTQQLESLVQENQLASAGNLIGKFIGGLTPENDRVSGWVVSVTREDGDVNLQLDNGWQVPIKSVESILDPTIFEEGQ